MSRRLRHGLEEEHANSAAAIWRRTLPVWIALVMLAVTTLGLAFIVVVALRTGLTLYLDLAIALGLVGFLATVAFARYMIEQRQ